VPSVIEALRQRERRREQLKAELTSMEQPAFIISPFVDPGTVSHGLFDHTSVRQLLGERFGDEAPHISHSSGKTMVTPAGFEPAISTLKGSISQSEPR
jgi:phospholipase C